jgi:DNA ligase-1
LWTRYFKTIQAPSWFLDALPPFCLDGELWLGRGRFQELSSIVKKLEPGPEWEQVRYKIFDLPMPSQLMKDGQIREALWEKEMAGCYDWYVSRLGDRSQPYTRDFESVIRVLEKELRHNEVATLHEQVILPYNTADANEAINARLEEVTNAGGEGLVLRKASSLWHPERSYNLLKVKKLQDAEGIVVGYTAGEKTQKGSKLLGLMGSACLRMDSGKEFDLSGFTDEERIMHDAHGNRADDYLSSIPGQRVPENIGNKKFPRGSRVTYRYRELTVDGKPKEARYLRKS